MIKHKFSNFSIRYFLNKRAKIIKRPFGTATNLHDYQSLMFEVIKNKKVNSKISLYYKLFRYGWTKELYMPYDHYFPVHEFEYVQSIFKPSFERYALHDVLVREMQAIEAIMQLSETIDAKDFTMANFGEAHQLGMRNIYDLFDRTLCRIAFAGSILYPEFWLIWELIKDNNKFNFFDYNILSYFQSFTPEKRQAIEEKMTKLNNIRDIFQQIVRKHFDSFVYSYYITVPMWYLKVPFSLFLKELEENQIDIEDFETKAFLHQFKLELESVKIEICECFVK